ncbi:hypothetical protein BGW80DRAFT_1414523 [Lactifluus volemus]|nr:hypothetical protein BGW80DRAFT_1414523 [Lactifluus volemus]
MPYDTADIHFYTDRIVVVYSSMTRSSFNNFLTFQISCRGIDWQVSSMAQLCNQLSGSFIISSIETLYIHAIQGKFPSTLEDVMDGTPWLELFHPFTAVRTLDISHTMQSHVVSALRGLSGELAMQVLPALEMLRIPWYQGSGPERHDMWPFIIARQRSNHPVVVHSEGMEDLDGIGGCPIPGCKTKHSRRQGFERHVREHLTHSWYCPRAGCGWRGHRHYLLQHHWRKRHQDVDPPSGEFLIFDPRGLARQLIDGETNIAQANREANRLVRERAIQLGKQDLWVV